MTSLTAIASQASEAKRPNIVVIVADDMGRHDLSSYGSIIRTPNLDRLANEGIKMSKYYVQPVCSPTRGSLMTGRYPFRLGLQHENLVGYRPAGLPLEEETMANMLQDCGYKTTMIGKWQLGFFKEQYLPDPKSDPALNGGFWGPYQVDEVIEEEEVDYGENYEYDHYSETTEVQDQPEVPWTPLTLTSNNRK